MNKVKMLTLTSPLYPEYLRNIPTPPRQLYYLGDLPPLLDKPRLAIVGSRKVSAYGRSVTLSLSKKAAEQGIVIVSGLALGVDGLAHQGCLEAGGKTIAVLSCGLDRIYPATHTGLARQILERGGAIISEYPVGTVPYKTNFLERNRIISGMSDAVLVTEAALRSGSLNTANNALEQGRSVLAVPGNITSELSGGTNNLLKLGATPITGLEDILIAMNLEATRNNQVIFGSTAEETTVLTLLVNGMTEVGELLLHSGLEAQSFNQTLSMLEITGKIRPLGAGHWGVM
jgi:DNA processing protein